MSLIKSIKHFPAPRAANKKALVMCGFGGSIWQTRRLTRVLHSAGYDVMAMDFLVERHWFGHIGTIIEETILFPKRVLGYIRQVESG